MMQQSLTKDRLNSSLNEIITESVNYEKSIRDVLDNVYNRGGDMENAIKTIAMENGVGITDLSGGIIPLISGVMRDSKIDLKDVILAQDTKLSLYTEVYLPAQLSKATHRLYSYVLFMPESDLLEYQNLIERNLGQVSTRTSYPDKRKGLFEMYMGLIKQFAGQDYLKNRKPEDMTRKEVLEIMQGIEREGLKLDVDLDVRIGGIKDEKEVKDEEVDALIQRFEDVSTELEKIIKLTDRFDFCLVSDNANRYYWLRLDQVF